MCVCVCVCACVCRQTTAHAHNYRTVACLPRRVTARGATLKRHRDASGPQQTDRKIDPERWSSPLCIKATDVNGSANSTSRLRYAHTLHNKSGQIMAAANPTPPYAPLLPSPQLSRSSVTAKCYCPDEGHSLRPNINFLPLFI
jgi:hypothetical protein